MGNFSYGLYVKIIIKVTAGWVIKDQSSLLESSLGGKGPKIFSACHYVEEIRGDLKVVHFIFFCVLQVSFNDYALIS